MRKILPKKPQWRRVDAFLTIIAVLALGLLYGYFSPSDLPQEYSCESSHQRAQGTDLSAASPTMDGGDDVASDAPVLRFLMYNVRNYFIEGEPQRTTYRLYPKSESSREAVADVIASVKPDVVGLIEMGGKMALEDLRQRLAARGLVYPHYRVLERKGDDRALALLSVHPIVDDQSRAHYGLYGNQKRKMLRGILDLTIQTEDGRRFCIVGVHNKSRVSEDAAAAASLRMKECRTLAMYLDERMKKSPRLPILVYGDWNDGPEDASLGVLQQGITAPSALHRLSPKDSTGAEWTLYYKAGKSYYIFDQIYLNKRLKSRLSTREKCGLIDIPAAAKASDHRAVWCELR